MRNMVVINSKFILHVYFSYLAWICKERSNRTDATTFVAHALAANLSKLGPCVVYEFV